MSRRLKDPFLSRPVSFPTTPSELRLERAAPRPQSGDMAPRCVGLQAGALERVKSLSFTLELAHLVLAGDSSSE